LYWENKRYSKDEIIEIKIKIKVFYNLKIPTVSKFDELNQNQRIAYNYSNLL